MVAIIEYMWVKVYKDELGNDRFIPQFRDDGTQQFWTDSSDIKPYKLFLVPINPELASKMQSKNIPAVSVPLPKYTFLLNSNDDVTAYWDNEIEIRSHYICEVCGNEWVHTDSTKFVQCPSCLTTDVWFCRRCPVEISADLMNKKREKEREYNSLMKELSEKFIESKSDQERNDIRERQRQAKELLDDWEIANQTVKIIDQKYVKRLTKKDEEHGKGKAGEINCPFCEIPFGLNRKSLLHRVNDIIENTDYVILVKNRYKVKISENEVTVESLQS